MSLSCMAGGVIVLLIASGSCVTIRWPASAVRCGKSRRPSARGTPVVPGKVSGSPRRLRAAR